LNTNDKFIKDLEETLAEIEAYQDTFRGKVGVKIYAIKHFFRGILNIPRRIKWTYQRAVRGYSEADSWNADNYLAKQIAGLMQNIMDSGHGVSTFYCGGNFDMPVEEMVALRDQDYKAIIAIFTEYAENGVAIDKGFKEKYGGVLDTELKAALQWLSEHFTELWD
jgi:hypothetical protein